MHAHTLGEQEEVLEQLRRANPGAQVRVRVGAELAPPGEHGGEEAVDAAVVLVRRQPVDAERERDLVLGGEVLERWAEGRHLHAAHHHGLAREHLDELSPHALRVLERGRDRGRAQHGEARA